MLVLSHGDVSCLLEISASLSTNEEMRETISLKLINGFENYADEDLVNQFGSRENLFKKRSSWLLENGEMAGKTSEEVFGSPSGRELILRILKSLNVSSQHLDDLCQEVIIKFWKNKHAEKYNPLKSPWSHHIKHAVKTCVYTFWANRQRNVLEVSSYEDEFGERKSKPTISFQSLKSNNSSSEEMNFEPYSPNQYDQNPETVAIYNEFLEEFKQFLREQKSFRSSIIRGYKSLCIELIPQEDGTFLEKELYVRSPGKNNFRVVNPEDSQGISFLVATQKLKVLNESSDLKCYMKDNPNYDTKSETQRLDRGPLDVFDLLDRGYQVDEIASYLDVGPSTAHNWVRKLQELFAEYWTITDMIPDSLQWMGLKHYTCSICNKQTSEEISSENCCHCGSSLENKSYEIPLKIYPWEDVRGSADIKKRSDSYRVGMNTSTCKM